MTFAVLCPGQAAQHDAVFDSIVGHPEGARFIERARAVLGEDPRDWTARTDAIYDNAIAQPLICLLQFAQWQLLRHELPALSLLAGYSIGELACYGVADAIDLEDLVRVARSRALAMDRAAATHPGGLVGVRGIARTTLERVCSQARAFVAIVIGDDAFVVGGDAQALDAVRAACARSGAHVSELRVAVASHTPLLQDAIVEFRAALEDTALRAPNIPIVAGIDGSIVTTRSDAIAALSSQIAHTVQWSQCMDALYERGCRVYLELSPGNALSRMLRDRFDDVDARAVDDFRDLAGATRWVMSRMQSRS